MVGNEISDVDVISLKNEKNLDVSNPIATFISSQVIRNTLLVDYDAVYYHVRSNRCWQKLYARIK